MAKFSEIVNSIDKAVEDAEKLEQAMVKAEQDYQNATILYQSAVAKVKDLHASFNEHLGKYSPHGSEAKTVSH